MKRVVVCLTVLGLVLGLTGKLWAMGKDLWMADGIDVCTAANSQGWPQITSDAPGEAVITWYDNHQSLLKEETRKEILSKVCSLQIPFIENKGQIKEKAVKYYAKTFGGTVFITKNGEIIYSLPKFEEGNETKGWTITETFIGASNFSVEANQKTETKVSYFKGSDPSKWQKNIPTYNLINLGKIYEGIEVKLKTYGNNIEKLFFVRPDANPEKIKVKIGGAYGLKVNSKGELEIRLFTEYSG